MATATMSTQTTNQTSAYERALERAHVAGLEVTGMGRTLRGDRFLVVPSATEPGRSHLITIQGAHLHCDCPAGQHERYCMHRALAHEWLLRESERRQALGAQRAQMEMEEREEERRRSPEGAHARTEHSTERHPLRWSDDAPVSMWR